MNFTNDEMNLMCIYNTGSRESLMWELREMRGYIGADQPELLAMTDSALTEIHPLSFLNALIAPAVSRISLR